MTQSEYSFSLRILARRLAAMGAEAVSPAGRQRIAQQLRGTVRRWKIGGVVLDRLRVMSAYFHDPAEPLKPKLLIGAALLYLIIPNDVIPDFIPGLGLMDDLAAIGYVWHGLQDILGHYEKRRITRMVGAE
jgi:uncharacterized membrane protein YkvA (DUF1232 family)